MKNKELIKIIEKKLKEFKDEYKPLNKNYFRKNSEFKDADVDRGAFLEQRIDDLNNILFLLRQNKKLLNFHTDMLKRAGIITNQIENKTGRI